MVCLTSFTMFSCTQDIDPDPTKLIGRWQLTEIVYNASTLTRPKPYNHRFEVELEFLPDGKVRGTTTFDNVAGLYETSSADSITIIAGKESKVGEVYWGKLFVKGFQSAKTYSLRNNRLYLKYEKNSLAFKKVK